MRRAANELMAHTYATSTTQQQGYVFLLYMVHGADLTWHFLNSPRQY